MKDFVIVGIQTDDTLMLGTNRFSPNKGRQLPKAKFCAKLRSELKKVMAVKFNGAGITMEGVE